MSNQVQPPSRSNLFDQNSPPSLERVDITVSSASPRSLRGFFRKRADDLLTLMRVVLGLVLVWSGLFHGKAMLSQDIWTLVIAWSIDMIDGRVSRSLKTDHQTWLGKNDVYIDMFVSVAVLSYLGITGLLSLGVILGYLLLWGALFMRWGIPPLLAQIFQNPIYAYFVFLTIRSAPQILPWLLLWALLALLLFWRRLIVLLKNVIHALWG